MCSGGLAGVPGGPGRASIGRMIIMGRTQPAAGSTRRRIDSRQLAVDSSEDRSATIGNLWPPEGGAPRRRQSRRSSTDSTAAAARECAHTYAHTAHPRAPTRPRRPRGPRTRVSVLNEIHHQQNSIQINKIVHEHGRKHKSKENIECGERCVQ